MKETQTRDDFDKKIAREKEAADKELEHEIMVMECKLRDFQHRLEFNEIHLRIWKIKKLNRELMML